jgi:hypothetical protein
VLRINAEEESRDVERHVKLFRIGRDQAVRIACEFALPGAEAIVVDG